MEGRKALTMEKSPKQGVTNAKVLNIKLLQGRDFIVD